ncbi:MAG: N-acetylneuraminate synthase family protein [Methanogenium sp.]|jgi:sialic acid synthase SpsE
MAEIILDVAPNTFKNDIGYFASMVNEIRNIDTKKYSITFKTQMFSSSSDAAKINICLDNSLLVKMHEICKEANYKFTSSVFDYYSLVCLLGQGFKLPFIKLACRENLYYLSNNIPRGIPVYISVDCKKYNDIHSYDKYVEQLAKRRRLILPIGDSEGDKFLLCVPEYPCKESDYQFDLNYKNVSDHTETLVLFDRWENDNLFTEKELRDNSNCCFEMHYVLERSQLNPDAGTFAKTISELSLIL